jgi:hypothetical protein
VCEEEEEEEEERREEEEQTEQSRQFLSVAFPSLCLYKELTLSETPHDPLIHSVSGSWQFLLDFRDFLSTVEGNACSRHRD